MPKDFQSGAFRTSDGCDIAFHLRVSSNPNAPRLALIHSLGLNDSVWDDVAARLGDQAHILTFDCRGHGRSCRKATTYTPELFARDLAELLEHVGWPSAVVVGCSMGGCVAQAFAGQYPSSVNALGLIDTTAWYGPEAPQRWRERVATAHTKGLGSMTDFQATRWFGDNFRAAHADSVTTMNNIFLANDVECYASTCIMLGDADLRHYLPSFHLPVAVVVGEEDYATPVAMARQIHEAVLGSTLTILPKARHLTPMECPEEIAAQILSLFKRVGSRQTAGEA